MRFVLGPSDDRSVARRVVLCRPDEPCYCPMKIVHVKYMEIWKSILLIVENSKRVGGKCRNFPYCIIRRQSFVTVTQSAIMESGQLWLRDVNHQICTREKSLRWQTRGGRFMLFTLSRFAQVLNQNYVNADLIMLLLLFRADPSFINWDDLFASNWSGLFSSETHSNELSNRQHIIRYQLFTPRLNRSNIHSITQHFRSINRLFQ